MASRLAERIDRRVHAALRFVDSAGRAIASPVKVSSEPAVEIFRNRRGLAVVVGAAGLEADEVRFETPTTPIGSMVYQLSLQPMDRRYAPRRFALRLPRDPDGANSADPASLFVPVEIELMASTAATRAGQAAAVCVTAVRADDGRQIEGALIRLVTPDGSSVRSVTNHAGEAMLIVYGLPLSAPGPGATVVGDHPAILDMIVDPDAVIFHDAALSETTPAEPVLLIDPDDVEQRLAATATDPQMIRIAAGRTIAATMTWIAS